MCQGRGGGVYRVFRGGVRVMFFLRKGLFPFFLHFTINGQGVRPFQSVAVP